MAFVQILLENGVDPNVRLNINGHLPIHFAASLGNHECIKLLHSKGADLNAPTYYGESVCSVAKDNATRNLLRELGNTGKNDSLFCAAKTLMWETGEKITSKVTPISKPESETLTVRTWRI
jgi:ankyrin repeat protein